MYQYKNDTASYITYMGGSYSLISAAWSDDEQYLALGESATNAKVIIYHFDGVSLTQITTFSTTGTLVNALAWSPDGTHLAVGFDATSSQKYCAIYSFNGTSFTEKYSKTNSNARAACYSVAWSSDSRYCAFGDDEKNSSYQIVTCFVEVVAISTYGSVASFIYNKENYGSYARGLSFSPDNQFLVFGTYAYDNKSSIIILEFTGSELREKSNLIFSSNLSFASGAWSPDGRYVVCGCYGNKGVKLYSVDQDTFALTEAHSFASTVDVRFCACDVFEKRMYFAHGSAASAYTFRLEEKALARDAYREQGFSFVGHDGGINTLEYSGTYALDQGAFKNTQVSLVDGEYYSGAIRLSNGFSIGADEAATLAISESVGGEIDLHDTGRLVFERDVVLAPGAQLVSGGTLEADGAALLLGGDTSIPEGKALHCVGDMVIDGGGRTLYVEPHAQLMVDANSTVTLRNMIINTNRIAAGKTQLDCAPTGKLCFDNVVFSLGHDLDLKGGQHFFHHDVVVTGSNALGYRSFKPAYIASQSSMHVQNGSTFLYAPYTNNSGLVKFADATSRLVVNNASLDVVGQGLRLTQGQLGLDNTVNVNVTSAFATPVVGTRVDTTYFGIKTNVWSPDGAWLSIDHSGTLKIFKYFDLSTPVFTATMAGYAYNGSTNDGVNLIAWTPDSDCFAFPSSSSCEISIYRIDSHGNCTVVTIVDTGDNSIYSLAFSPDGKWLAVGRGSGYLLIYPVNADKTLGAAVSSSNVTCEWALAWSPNGRCLALSWAGEDSYRLKVGTINESGVWTFSQNLGMSGNIPPSSITWSPDGAYLAATYPASGANDAFYIYSVNQETGAVGARVTGAVLKDPHTSSWSSDSQYLLVGRSSSYNNFLVYRIRNGVATLVQTVSTDTYPYKLVAWHPAGELISAQKTNSFLCTFPVTYNYVTSGAPAAALTLGNGGADATQDCDIRYSAATTLHVSGSVVVDPASV